MPSKRSKGASSLYVGFEAGTIRKFGFHRIPAGTHLPGASPVLSHSPEATRHFCKFPGRPGTGYTQRTGDNAKQEVLRGVGMARPCVEG